MFKDPEILVIFSFVAELIISSAISAAEVAEISTNFLSNNFSIETGLNSDGSNFQKFLGFENFNNSLACSTAFDTSSKLLV